MEEPSAPRRVLVSHAAPTAFAPMTLTILAKLGYEIFEPDAFAEACDGNGRPDCLLVDERGLCDLDAQPGVPVVALTGRHGVTGADPRVVGAIRRPAGMHDLFRLLQLVLEDTPRTSPRVPTHLRAQCVTEAGEWIGTILSLSENGCLLRSPEPLLLGTRLRLGFELPRCGPFELESEVSYQLVPEVGLLFPSVSPDVRRGITGFVTEALAAR